jgi:hypothetical protein
MKQMNFEHMAEKIRSMLLGWTARGLSLLGRILIYKMFGLSQVIYILSIMDIGKDQHKIINSLFNNFIWGRNGDETTSFYRISRERMNTPIEYGGFGMINYKDVIDGIGSRQLLKLYDQNFTHPLKGLIVEEDRNFHTGVSLRKNADDVAKMAHDRIWETVCRNIKKVK